MPSSDCCAHYCKRKYISRPLQNFLDINLMLLRLEKMKLFLTNIKRQDTIEFWQNHAHSTSYGCKTLVFCAEKQRMQCP